MRNSILLIVPLLQLININGVVDAQQNCTNSHEHCAFWSQRGECEINPRYMKKNCRKACGTCTIRRHDSPTPRSGVSVGEISPRPSVPDGCNSVMTVEAENRQIFSASQQMARFKSKGCADQQISPDCSINQCYHKKYRSMDGTCNNLQSPTKGAAFTPYLRLQPADYDDGVNSIVSSSRRNRPNAREVSVFLLSSEKSVPTHANSLLMAFGQFVSHDITSLAQSPLCPCGQIGPLCASVAAPPNDHSRRCLAFTRAFPVCGSGQFGRVREQLNMNTAAIDASLIYGSEAITARSLRFGAMLRTTVMSGKMFPPIASGNNLNTGDQRANLFVGLAALHTSFLRLHNTLASRLQNMNRHWTSDRIFQETRKIVGAVVQIITYNEFLPTLIGDAAKTHIHPYTGYNPNVEMGILNEFSGSAYRLHGMIREQFPLLNSNFQKFSQFSFIEGVNQIHQVLSDIDALYRGLMSVPSRSPQRLTTSVTERLFQGTLDMASMNIQRGRDLGLRSYNDYRRFCNLSPINDFNNWPEVSDPNVRQRVSQLYRSPNDLDLYVGGLLEKPQAGSVVGATFSCIIAHQFERLRDGDRFYFENRGVFTSQQLAELKQITLSSVICLTGNRMSTIGRKAFEIENGSRAVPCSSIHSLDLESWKE